MLLKDVTPGKIDLFLSAKENVLSARSVNHLRGYLSRAFTMARRMERFPRANPVADVPKRKVVKRLPDYLRPVEVLPLLASLTPKWKNLFATAIYTGMRKGELFALRKSDVDFDAGLVMVGRSHDRDIPKGGRVDAIPINSELLVYLKRAMAPSRSELVFRADDGSMLPKHTKLEEVLRRAMRRAGLVTGYVHKCRRHGCDPSQAGEKITDREGEGIQPSQPFAENTRNFAAHLLPESWSAPGATSARVGPPSEEVPGWGHGAPGTAPRVRTTPTTADLVSYWGGRHRLLRVKEVAEQLAVPAWRVYQLCEDGELPHVRIINSIRVRPQDLEDFMAARLTVPEECRPHRRKEPPP
ncbi:MAG TPA: tyrosine-type recombinase/integrase [Polyangia bacterium]